MAVNILGWWAWTDNEKADLEAQAQRIKDRIAAMTVEADRSAKDFAARISELNALQKRLRNSLGDGGEWMPVKCNAVKEGQVINYYSVKDGSLVWSEPVVKSPA